jgi:cytochrome bd-type quinol oxidase subunit 2
MIQKLKLALLSSLSLIMFSAPLVLSGVASAAPPATTTTINNNLCSGANIDFSGASTDCTGNDGATADSLVNKAINVISLIVGAVAVIMLIVGGFRYVTSGGKQESVAGAKTTITYALVGLVIVAVAQVVVHFVLNSASQAVTAG